MNNSFRITARWLRIGFTLLLAIGLLSAVSTVWARSVPSQDPDVANGVVNHACPDAYEVDDLFANAQTLAVGAPQQHNFDGNTNTGIADKDWVRFQVTRLSVYTLTTSNLSAQTDTFIKLYDAGGNPVYSNGVPVENDDSGAADFGSQIVWTAPDTSSGWYYLLTQNSPKSSAAYANCAGTVVSYTLSLQSKVPFFLNLPIVANNY